MTIGNPGGQLLVGRWLLVSESIDSGDTVWLEGPGERQSVTGVDQLSVGSTSSLLHGGFIC